MYADDTFLTISSNIVPNLWYEVNELTLNVNKTNSLFFEKSPTSIRQKSNLMVILFQ